MDEFFVVLGYNLAKRIVKRDYCDLEEGTNCNTKKKLVDTNYGGSSLGIWISEFGRRSVVVFNHNEKLVHKAMTLYKDMDLDKVKFCKKYMVWHKASAEEMYKIHGQMGNRTASLEWAKKAYYDWPGVRYDKTIYG